MRALVIVAALVLAGCAGPKPQIRTVEVKVPIATKCAAQAPSVPDYATDHLTLDESIHDLVRALLIERLQLRAENGELRAGLEGCR